MAVHIWLSKKSTPEIRTRFGHAYLYALKNHTSYDPRFAAAFAAYVVETIRQAGGGNLVDGRINDRSIWLAALRSRHRWSKGRNWPNYLAAGLRIFLEIHADLNPHGLEPLMLADWIEDPDSDSPYPKRSDIADQIRSLFRKD